MGALRNWWPFINSQILFFFKKKEGSIKQGLIMGMWFEILPSVAIMVSIFVGGDALAKLHNKLMFGVKQERDVVNPTDMALWKRDYQHSYKAFGWNKHHGSPFQGKGLEAYTD